MPIICSDDARRHPGARAFLDPLYCCGDKDCFPVACDQLVGTVYDKDQVQAKLLAFLKA
jgi:hypothetical protein